MPIAETVVALADCIASAREPLNEWERLLVDALRTMPKHRDASEIDQWEHEFLAAWRAGAPSVENPDGFFTTSRLLSEVFELGRENLYTAFTAPTGTYRELVRSLNVHHNITAPDDLDVAVW